MLSLSVTHYILKAGTSNIAAWLAPYNLLLPSKIKIFVKWSNFESLEDIDSKATTVAY
jgi:hypothetical protein